MATFTWDGSGADNLWSDGYNWNVGTVYPGGVPGAGDTAIIGTPTADLSVFTNIVIQFGTSGGDGGAILTAPNVDFGWKTTLDVPSGELYGGTLAILGTGTLDDGNRPSGSPDVAGAINIGGVLTIELGSSSVGGTFYNHGTIDGKALHIAAGGTNTAIFENDQTMDLAVLVIHAGATMDGAGEVLLTGTNANLDVEGTVASGQLFSFVTYEPSAQLGGAYVNDLSTFQGTIELTASNYITVNGFGATQKSYSGGVLTFSNNQTIHVLLGAGASSLLVINEGGATLVEAIACFAEGTHIATATGTVPVEALVPGDTVLLADGDAAEVRWLGHRRVDCTHAPRPDNVWPVRIAPGAFGPGAPARELWLSPDHAVFAGGVLIPVRYLVNGATVVQHPVDAMTYWHVELDRHAVLLAEGLPCESYLDSGNRAAFANGGAVVQAHPDFARAVWSEQACAPLLLSGSAVEAARAALWARARELGHGETTDPHLRVRARGRMLRPEFDGRTYRLSLPEGTRTVRLCSRVGVPAWRDGGDHRRLGVAVAALRLDGRNMPFDDPRLGAGWHGAEPYWRWTDGAAVLVTRGARQLELELAMTERYWSRARAA
jgi:hypothetical protein